MKAFQDFVDALSIILRQNLYGWYVLLGLLFIALLLPR
ncbi:hypothetical protein CLV24_113123 [Pontibacter ummariensis]|uniref:Uncharacterized protein n=1 Tax=Pontibacter ummariensis TaxID=1610492 RepID=A0A239H938_9BACT|nr:hypothetical protein CLV24_113123 [Pontibacter ummariensis]SNS77772.1 hypothetical protein SAMN06296052_11332 [Pontibacter ummariensis]